MKPVFAFKSVNTILYCKKWQETVTFYQDDLGLPVNFATDWFVEFHLGGTAYLSVANEQRAKVKSSDGSGITITLQVENAGETWQSLHNLGLNLEPVRRHAWGAQLFYLYDPEGHRLEIWSPV